MIPNDEIVTDKSLSGIADLFTRLDAVEKRLEQIETILLATRDTIMQIKEVRDNQEIESNLRWAFYELRSVKRDGTPAYWGGVL